MPSVPHNPRGEEKLKLILGQLSAVRARVNGFAFQQAIFVALALLISAATIILLAAFTLAPLIFLTIAVTAALICLAGLALAGRHMWRMRKTAEAVAALTDERAALKDRMLTIIAMHKQSVRSPLWPYLVEDANLKRDEFAPSRIQRRRISRTLYVMVASILLAALASPLMHHAPRHVALARRAQTPLTLNLRDLNIQPSDHPSGNGARLSGDPNTMRKLAQMMAEAQRKERNKNLLSKMKRSAQDFANNLQDKITGRQPPLDIRLADNGGPNSNPASPPADQNLNSRPDSNTEQPSGSGSPQSSAQAPAHGSQETQPGGNQSPLAMQAPPNDSAQGRPQPGFDSRPFADPQRNGNDDAGGASHGTGTDPQGLYGPPENNGKSEGSFQIAIDARPGATGHAANRGYPPRVNAPLNPAQHADEPISRTDVPAEDRSTIKRIFER
jgi:hypothetical protein